MGVVARIAGVAGRGLQLRPPPSSTPTPATATVVSDRLGGSVEPTELGLTVHVIPNGFKKVLRGLMSPGLVPATHLGFRNFTSQIEISATLFNIFDQ